MFGNTKLLSWRARRVVHFSMRSLGHTVTLWSVLFTRKGEEKYQSEWFVDPLFLWVIRGSAHCFECFVDLVFIVLFFLVVCGCAVCHWVFCGFALCLRVLCGCAVCFVIVLWICSLFLSVWSICCYYEWYVEALLAFGCLMNQLFLCWVVCGFALCFWVISECAPSL